tara:strand:- start:5846 stop:6103 length:258 start_codon:yes stop_codon:yes gene_type:complete
MSSYYCPFCSSRYQFHKINSEGVLICGLCGEGLMRKPLINVRKIIGLFTALVFLAPLFIIVIFLIKDFKNEILPNNSESVVTFDY